MANRAREAVAPAYLFLCLIAGGSAQGIWANMVLQLLAIAILAWAALATSGDVLARPVRQLLIIVSAGLALITLQLIPLPPSIWSALGGRSALASGFSVLGLTTPAFPLSLSPYDSLRALLTLLPPLAMLCAMVRLKAYRPSWLAAALLAGTFAGILLGALQVASGNPETSPWYLFEETNPGLATGFFANANHMATLLVITLPFLAALPASAERTNVQRHSALVALVAGAALVVILGIVLNRSLAGYVLALPVLATSALILMPAQAPWRRWVLVVSGLCLVGALGALESSAIRPGNLGTEAATSVESREAILETTVAATRDFFPFGSGVGTFRPIYDFYEDHDRTTSTYVIHAHNDYAELALEAGVPGVAVLLVFLAWWGAAVARAWRSADAGAYARAASIASAAILVHSLVDFPLRTAAISTCFAMCLALLADRRAPPAANKSELRPTRHVVLG